MDPDENYYAHHAGIAEYLDGALAEIRALSFTPSHRDQILRWATMIVAEAVHHGNGDSARFAVELEGVECVMALEIEPAAVVVQPCEVDEINPGHPERPFNSEGA